MPFTGFQRSKPQHGGRASYPVSHSNQRSLSFLDHPPDIIHPLLGNHQSKVRPLLGNQQTGRPSVAGYQHSQDSQPRPLLGSQCQPMNRQVYETRSNAAASNGAPFSTSAPRRYLDSGFHLASPNNINNKYKCSRDDCSRDSSPVLNKVVVSVTRNNATILDGRPQGPETVPKDTLMDGERQHETVGRQKPDNSQWGSMTDYEGHRQMYSNSSHSDVTDREKQQERSSTRPREVRTSALLSTQNLSNNGPSKPTEDLRLKLMRLHKKKTEASSLQPPEEKGIKSLASVSMAVSFYTLTLWTPEAGIPAARRQHGISTPPPEVGIPTAQLSTPQARSRYTGGMVINATGQKPVYRICFLIRTGTGMPES